MCMQRKVNPVTQLKNIDLFRNFDSLGKKRPRHTRHLDKRNYAYAYQFLDDDDGDLRTQWAAEAPNTADWGEEQQQAENPTWEAERETAAPETEQTSRWSSSPDSYWGISTPRYSEASSPVHDSYKQEPEKSETEEEPYWFTTTPTTTATTVPIEVPQELDKAAPVATEVPIWRRIFATTTPAPVQPLALPLRSCPHRFDAVTRGELFF
ncbi:unnamed protein product [Gongylonema pulchrum]|uniref:Uncharacterized protein n=1 Tax=Gongylonema pulchrum TaxID=637853 RepID=A0A183D1Q0_9BILA|nr:unnamed protein product [Gongylonema pulchrum]